MSKAEARLAGRVLFASVRFGALLVFAALLLSAGGVVDKVTSGTALRAQAVAHVIENWPEPILQTRLPRHVVSEEGSRVRVKVRIAHPDAKIAVLVALPAMPAQYAGKIRMPWRQAIVRAGHRPRPYDARGPPRQVV